MPKKREKLTETKKETISQELLENFVHMQKVMTNVANKLDNLTINIAELLKLFEGAAMSFTQKQSHGDLEKDKEFLDKLNTLVDQNKTIAKGLTLMEEKIREKLYGPSAEQRISINPKPFPRL